MLLEKNRIRHPERHERGILPTRHRKGSEAVGESREIRTGKILLRQGRSRHYRRHWRQNDAVRRRAAYLPGLGIGHRPHSFNACQNAAGI